MDREEYTNNKLLRFNLSPEEEEDVLEIIDLIRTVLDTPVWQMSNPHDLKSQRQVGFLAGSMKMERDDRLDLLELIIGRDTFYKDEVFPGYTPVAELPEERQVFYPGKSSKDVTITKWEAAVLIDFFTNNPNADRLRELYGY